jgi:hypothetical protein
MRKCTLRRHAVDVNEEWPLHPDVSRSGRASVQPCRFQVGSQLLRRCRKSTRHQSARRTSASSVEVIQRSEDRVTLTKRYKLSPDLKTLTITTRIVGRKVPNIFVFERRWEAS